jgi:hypothetical protein
MFALLVLGLAANSVNFYTAGPSDERASGAPLATAGCSLCILAVRNPRLTIHAQRTLALIRSHIGNRYDRFCFGSEAARRCLCSYNLGSSLWGNGCGQRSC